MQVQPYLFFDGHCEEAVNFYRSALGAEVTMLMRFKDSPESAEPGMVPPGAEDKAMHQDKVMHMSFPHRRHHADGFRWPPPGTAELQWILVVAHGGGRCRGRSLVCRSGSGRAGADAHEQDFLCLALRHGRGSLWGVMDGHRDALSAARTTFMYSIHRRETHE